MVGGNTHIGSYRILRKIGEGGMGAVYVGEHRLLGSQVAIKVLLPSLSANAEIVKRFFNEARAVTRIADPGLVQVFDFGRRKNGSAYLVMELLRGEPMDQRLRRIARFTPRACVRLLAQICTSLDIVHAHGIVHRDLKPENLFLAFDPAMPGGERAKILDFGIAKLSGDEPSKHKTQTGLVMGTPYYMSPEQCSGGVEVDHRSDVYAIGCVMFKMLTGRPPFDGKGAGDLLAHHLREPAPRVASLRADVPPALDAIVERCLRKDARERFPSMAALVGALLAAERTLPTGPTGTAPSTAPSAAPSIDAGDGDEPVLGPGWDFTEVSVRRRPARPTTLHGANGEASAFHVDPLADPLAGPLAGPLGARVPWSWLAGGAALLVALALFAVRGDHAVGPGKLDIDPAAAPRTIEVIPPPPPAIIPQADAGVATPAAPPAICIPASAPAR